MSISTVTSEALQLKLRQLLPSQQGFGTDLSASDTIIPIIDLTAAAEGSDTPEYLQTAIAFGSQTSFAVNGTTSTIINNTGFFRIFGSYLNSGNSGGFTTVSIAMTDGLSSKNVWQNTIPTTSSAARVSGVFDFVVFCDVGVSVTAQSDSLGYMAGSTRQVADINGSLVQPVGFTPQ